MNSRRGMIALLVCALAVACSAPAAPTETARARIPTVTPRAASAPAIPPKPSPTPRAAPEERLTRYFTSPAAQPLAVCNDGSTPAFYLARGAGQSERDWVIVLEGDGFCTDQASCGARGGLERSTRSLPQWTGGAGIASADPAQNPDFWNWNRVVLIYCTSDLWTGTRYEQDGDTGFYFRGHYVLNAFLDALMDAAIVEPPTLRAGNRVLLAGTGAGGEGLLHNLNRMAARLSPLPVRAVVDGATAPWVSPYLQQEREERQFMALRRWMPRLDESCMAVSVYRDINCQEADYLVLTRRIVPPLFVRQDQADAHAYANQMLTGNNATQLRLKGLFAQSVRFLAEQQSGAFAPASGIGVTLTSPEFNRQQINGVTLAQALGNWYFERKGPQRLVAPGP